MAVEAPVLDARGVEDAREALGLDLVERLLVAGPREAVVRVAHELPQQHRRHPEAPLAGAQARHQGT